MNRYGLFVLAFWCVILGIVVGANLQQYNDQHADITVLPCSAFEHTSEPVVPPFTFQGACMTPNGSLSTPEQPDLGQLPTK